MSASFQFFTALRKTRALKTKMNHDLTITQLMIFSYLAMLPEPPVFKAVAEALELSRPSLSRNITALEEVGLVQRLKPRPGDDRTFRLGVSKKGARIISDVESLLNDPTELQRRVLGNFQKRLNHAA